MLDQHFQHSQRKVRTSLLWFLVEVQDCRMLHVILNMELCWIQFSGLTSQPMLSRPLIISITETEMETLKPGWLKSFPVISLFPKNICSPLGKEEGKMEHDTNYGIFFFNIWQRKCLFSSKGGMTLALNKCLRIRMFCFFLHIFSGWMSNSWAETLFLSWNCRNKLDASDETYSGCHYICLNVLAVIQPELISSTMGKHSFLLSFQWVKKAYG